ncbi:YggT family protein [Clostridium beijerinckii]|uniref:YggT family protein n=1 Tax=Clostridium beijerinckii TaxID=1520 RepID=UPI0003D3402E|nr:YggT family protein [Clostridium beijerinckii]ALB47128.1 YggT family protein [Clostridium beijerinckii NRRL B-598]
MIYSVYIVIDMFLNILELAIFIECIVSWIPQIQGNRFIDLLHSFVSPVLEPIRKLQYRLSPGLPLDFSPIFALIIINFLQRIIP